MIAWYIGFSIVVLFMTIFSRGAGLIICLMLAWAWWNPYSADFHLAAGTLLPLATFLIVVLVKKKISQ